MIQRNENTQAATTENKTKVPQKLTKQVPQDTAIPFLGSYPKNMRIQIQSSIYTPISAAAFLTIVKI